MPVSTLTMHFRENIPDEEFREITHKLMADIAELTTWSGVYLHAVSAGKKSIEILLNLAVELCAFCHVRFGKPIFEGVLLHRDIDWNWGDFDKNVLDELDRISEDSEGILPRGFLAIPMFFQKEVLTFLFNYYPKLPYVSGRNLKKPRSRVITEPPMVGVNLWEILENYNNQNQVLLASDLSVQIAVSFSDRMKELIFEISREPRVLRSLNSRKVEELVAGLIEDKGFMVELTAKTRDGGRDIIAVKGKGELLKDEKYLIEVKHPEPDNPVSVGVVRELVGVGTVEPSTGLVLVSTTRFTRDAVELAARETLRYRLSLRDYKDLMDWIERYCKKRGS